MPKEHVLYPGFNEDSTRGQQLPNFIADSMRDGSPFSPPDPATQDGPKSSPELHILGPRFVEWMMGWPIGWTGLEGVETESSLWWQRMRGALSRLNSKRNEGMLF